MNKKFLLVFFLLLVPFCTQAATNEKSSIESDNLKEKQHFLKGGALLWLNSPYIYPIPVFMKNTGVSINFTLNTEKGQYKAGEKVQIAISAEDNGFIKNTEPALGEKLFYLWAGGNFYVEIYRLSDAVKDGEFLVAAGKAYPDDPVSLFQREKKEFVFDWQTSGETKKGDYEIRIYPASAGVLFKGTPDAYRSFLKTRIKVESDPSKEEKTVWGLDGMTLAGDKIQLKERVLYLDAKKDYDLTVPLQNFGAEREQLLVTKQVVGLAPRFSEVLSEETEEVALEPGEKKLVGFKLNGKNIKNEAGVMVYYNFRKDNGQPGLPSPKYFTYPISNLGGETVMLPFSVLGNVSFDICGLGIYTAKNRPGFIKDSSVVIFSEVQRRDPLFYNSAEQENTGEKNIKLDLVLQDRDGNKIDEIGYEGSSWDRTGEIYKSIKLGRDYDYLRLVASLKSEDGKQIENKELEYNLSLKKMGSFEKNKDWLENNKIVFLLGAAGILLIGGILTAVLILNKSSNKGYKSNKKRI